MDAIALFYSAPLDPLLRGSPWLAGEVAFFGLLPGALHRHPALKLAGAWAGFSSAILAHAYAVCLLVGPDALGFPFIASGNAEAAAFRALAYASFLPLLAYVAVGILIEARDPRLIHREEMHMRALWARLWSWATGKSSPRNTKGEHYVG